MMNVTGPITTLSVTCATTYDNANVHVSTVAKASPTYSYTSILSKQQHSETVAKNLMNSKRIPVHGSTTLSVTKRPTERRVSSRSIKRKKFDDEVVESSLNQGAGGSRGKFVTNEPSIPDPTPPPKEKVKANCKLKRPVRRGRKLVALAEMGRWKPQDDLMLINSVQQVCDLTAVYKGVKFSTHFTKDEIQQRWYALLYDSNISKLAMEGVKSLHPEVLNDINSKSLFSKCEEEALKKISSNTTVSVEIFSTLLAENPTVFLHCRNAKSLMKHWLLMKQYQLLPDQPVQPLPKGEHVLNFSESEDAVQDIEIQEPVNEKLEEELSCADRRVKHEIRQLEQELSKWQVLVEQITGVSAADFDNQTLAVLRGRLVRYLMRSREISIGRTVKNTTVDIDLSLEGPASKVSRNQGIIKLRNTGEFYIFNEGKRPIYVDGKAVVTGSKTKLNNNSVVEVANLRFIFQVNIDVIATLQAETARKLQS